jgi:methionyl-tRNA synthetase
MLSAASRMANTAGEHFEHYRFREGVIEVMNLARAANKYFNDAAPWKTATTDRERCETTIHVCVQLVRSLAILMAPVTPSSSERIWKMLNLPESVNDEPWDKAAQPVVPAGHALGTPEILFVKIEDAIIEHELKNLGTPAVPPPASPAPPAKETITIGDFQKVDLRVAKVLSCERVPKSEKLLKLQVDVGGEQRQIVAGIAQHCTPEQLIGMSVVVVFNLQPAKLMGQESRGMLLAASDGTGKLVVLSPSAEISPGSVVK